MVLRQASFSMVIDASTLPGSATVSESASDAVRATVVVPSEVTMALIV